MRLLLCCGALAVICLGPRPDAIGATLDELKGLSIEVNWSRSSIFGNVPRPVSQNGKIQVYVGLNGHIFEYNHLEQFDGQRSYSSVNTPDKAVSTTRSSGLVSMHGWTAEGGKLQLIAPLDEGFAVTSIVVDPVKMTCTYEYADRPDPKTGRVVTMHPTTGAPYQVMSRTPGSSTCSVRRGNIFASDQ
jgi:hypothetical protein